MADRRLLVVEGPDDMHVICAILKRHQFQLIFKVEPQGGYETLLERLSPRLKPGTDLERFGLVVDADADLAARWQSLKNALIRAGYRDLPDRPDPSGTVVDHEDLPRLGLWIMPNNTLPGMLEEYLSVLVPEGDDLIEHARECLKSIPKNSRRFAPAHHTKALLHTWLAWQEDPGTPLGLSITKRYFETDVRSVTDFLQWLTRLFA